MKTRLRSCSGTIRGESAPVFRWKMWGPYETGEGVSSWVASDDGWRWFFRSTFCRVQRVQCDVKHYMAFDLQVQTKRLLHKKSREPRTPNTVDCEHETPRIVNRKQCKVFFRCSNFKPETVSRAGQIVWHWRWLYTCPTHTSGATHLCGIADGSGGLAVLVCACWALEVSAPRPPEFCP